MPRGVRSSRRAPRWCSRLKVLPKEAAEQTVSEMAERNPMGRVGDSREIAADFAFLAFDATYTTGAELDVDCITLQLRLLFSILNKLSNIASHLQNMLLISSMGSCWSQLLLPCKSWTELGPS